MPNFDGQWELRTFYSVTLGARTLNHVNTVDVNLVDANPSPGDAFSSIFTTPRVSGGMSLEEYWEDYILLALALFGDEMAVNRVELWKYPPDSTDATFLSAHTPVDFVGSNLAPCREAQQTTFTFRTYGGGILRSQWMETSFTIQTKDPYPTASPQGDAFMEFFINEDSAIVGRDDQYVLALLNMSNGQNEKLWRKRYRE